MRILLGISILVLVAILGTMVAIVRHIRVTRRRNQLLREQQNALQFAPLPMPTAATVTPLPARFAAPSLPASRALPVAALTTTGLSAATEKQKVTPGSRTETSLPASPPTRTPQSTPVIVTAPLPSASPSLPATPVRHVQPATAGISSSRHTVAASSKTSTEPISLLAAARKLSQELPEPPSRPSLPKAAPVPPPTAEEPVLRILEFIPDSTTKDVFPSAPAFPSLAAAPPVRVLRPMPLAPEQDPHVRRPVRSVPSQAKVPAKRADWAYFNKDMGDLSDPLPHRVRDRLRSR